HVARSELRATLRHVGIVGAAAARCAHRFAATETTPPPAAAGVADAEALAVFAVNGEAVRYAVHEWTGVVHDASAQQTSDDLAASCLVRADAARESVLDREVGSARYGDQHAAALHEAFEILNSLEPEPGANVVGLVQL